MLTYAQLQQLKAGEPIKAAQTALVVATGQVSSAFAEMAGMLRMISISYQEPIEAQGGTMFLMAAVGTFAIFHVKRVRRLKQLMEEHEVTEMLDPWDLPT